MKKIKHLLFGSKQSKENQQVKADSKSRLSQISRNMSCGAANLFKTIRTHSAWGNKQLWGAHEKGRGKAGHHTPIGHHNKKK